MLDTAVVDNDGSQASEEQAQVQSQYGDKNEKLPEILQTALRDLVRHYQGLDKFVRRAEVMEARRQRFYERGDQYIYWDAHSMMFMPVNGGTSVSAGSTAVDMPRYTDVYNIFQPYERSLIAVLTQNPPGVEFEPDDPNAPSDISAADTAMVYKSDFDRVNDRPKLQSKMARLFCTDGRVVAHTHTIADEQRFGADQNGAPKQAEIVDIYGVLESKVPIISDGIEDWPYCVLSKEIDINLAKKNYPEAASKIKSGLSSVGESAYERMARLGVLQGTRLIQQAGDAFAHMVTRHRCWLRPAAFEHCKDQSIKEQLLQIFPNGCHVIFCGDAYCGSWDESMDDCLAVGHPMPGDGQYRPSMMKSIVPVQDAFNDLMNLRKEIYDYCIPATWWDKAIGDEDAIRDQISEPGNHIPCEAPAGKALEQCFFVEPPASVPGDMIQAMNDLQGQLAQFITGAMPALFGGSMEDQKTARGYQMARDQAMGQQGMPWAAMKELFSKIYYQAALSAGKNRDESVNVKIDNQVLPLSFTDLEKGNFHCHPNADGSFPETVAMKRAQYQAVAEMAKGDPTLAQILQLPDNMEFGKEMLGLPELVIPQAEARNKQMEEINQLLKEQPIPPSPQELEQAGAQYAMTVKQAQIQGMQPPPPPDPNQVIQSMMQPSVPIDVEWDFHQYEYEKVQDWLNSKAGRDQIANGNLAGIQNVKLHGELHKKAMQAQQQAQAKPPSESINFADLPPAGQIQMAKQAGIQLTQGAPNA